MAGNHETSGSNLIQISSQNTALACNQSLLVSV